MKKACAVSAFCTLLLLFAAESALAQITAGCARAADEGTRLETAREILKVNATNYESVINHWAEDVIYREPVLTNSGRQEMLDYLAAVFGGSEFGFPMDKAVTIKDELHRTHGDGSMTYVATIEWTGTFGPAFFIQTGMSIIKFRPGQGCPYFHRDYFSEGDTWWNIPAWQPEIRTLRNVYISLFKLTGRCFDDDGDGYTKYSSAAGCAEAGVDCNDFVPEMNPGAEEVCDGLGVDEDCDGLTDSEDPDCP